MPFLYNLLMGMLQARTVSTNPMDEEDEVDADNVTDQDMDAVAEHEPDLGDGLTTMSPTGQDHTHARHHRVRVLFQGLLGSAID